MAFGMNRKYFSALRRISVSAVILTLFAVASPCSPAEEEMLSRSDFDRLLIERAEKYFDSICARNDVFMNVDRKKMENRALHVIKKGLARFHRGGNPAYGEMFQSFDREKTVAALARLGRPHAGAGLSGAFAFLSMDLRQPAERDVAICVAFPSRFDRQRMHGVLNRHCPSGMVIYGVGGLGTSGAAMAVFHASSTFFKQCPDRKMVSSASFGFDSDASLGVSNEPVPTGFPLIARTIVLRI